MCDGIATLVMTASFDRKGYTPDMFNKIVPKLTLIQKIQLYLTLPYGMLLACMRQFNQKLEFNDVYNGSKLTGEKTLRFTKPLQCGTDLNEKLKIQKGGPYR